MRMVNSVEHHIEIRSMRHIVDNLRMVKKHLAKGELRRNLTAKSPFICTITAIRDMVLNRERENSPYI